MVKLKIQYPYIDNDGTLHENLIKTYAEDENGAPYYILQNQTNIEYSEAVDIYPSKYTYTATNKVVKNEVENN